MIVDEPREPLRDVVADEPGLDACFQALADADGPVAFDVERAHGYRYWPKAYLFQIRREGAGTWLIDPTKFSHARLADLARLLEDACWVLHAASQDLPSMYEAGVVPRRIWDTELAARLLGKQGVSLGALLEGELGIGLRKQHSAVNWATRPLKESWLRYAALDVDYLLDLQQVLDDELGDLRRREWAEQEFEQELKDFARTPTPRPEPWRRISQITAIKSPAGLALARELWQERDAIAKRRDRPPTHILPDKAIVEAARSPWPDAEQLKRIQGFRQPAAQRHFRNWVQAVERAEALPAKRYPSKRPASSGGPPHVKQWERQRPEAARRWAEAKPRVDELACEIGVQPSLLAPPAVLQEVLWSQARPDERKLLAAGARPWQADLLGGLFEHLFG